MLEIAVSARLLGAPAIADPTEGRIEWMRRSDGVLPAIVLQIISDPRPQHLKGFMSARPTRVQVDVWAASPRAAAELREAVITVLIEPAHIEGVRFGRAQIVNVRPGFEQLEAGSDQQPRGELYRESIDVIFTHNS